VNNNLNFDYIVETTSVSEDVIIGTKMYNEDLLYVITGTYQQALIFVFHLLKNK